MFRNALILAGAAQLGIAVSSLLIPRLLGWRAETAQLKPLTRQVFWTYASYILGIHVAFGLLALLAPALLLDGSALARAVCGFIAVYWLVRLTLQFVAFDRSVAAGRPLFRFAEAAYVSTFAYLVLVYGATAVR
ncbi:MAG TPA: hypothetical protein VFP80_01655 [Thermoanaerobaculia bacterium]|nr:hypothetical protein [Thermoanaerobaculia bacterium]